MTSTLVSTLEEASTHRPIRRFPRDIRRPLLTSVGCGMAHDDRVPRRINNDVIPFDLLGQIMQSMIDDFDSEHDPYILGRLQLVCRSWAVAAKLHPRLWSILRICIGEQPIRFWLHYVRSHLSRAGSIPHLDIRLRGSLSRPWWPEFPVLGDGYTVYRQLLQSLTGINGEVAAKWKSFVYQGMPILSDFESWLSDCTERLFSFPTPHLDHFECILPNTSPGASILPHTPLLQSLKWIGCGDIALSGLMSTPRLPLTALDIGMYKTASPLIALLPRAMHLTSLRVGGHGLLVFPVGSSFPHLRDLTIADTIPQSKAFRYFSAPKLQVLRVSAQIFRNSSILKCIGIPFANIRHLEVTCDIDYQVESQESDLYALEVLAVVPNLQKLVIRQYDRSCGRCSSICAHAMKMFRGHLDLIVYYLPGREPAGAMDISRAHSIVVG